MSTPRRVPAALARGMISETAKENCHLSEIRLSDQEVAEDRGSSPIFHTSRRGLIRDKASELPRRMANPDLPTVVVNQGDQLRCNHAGRTRRESWENGGKVRMPTSDSCGMRSAVCCRGCLLSYWYNFEK